MKIAIGMVSDTDEDRGLTQTQTQMCGTLNSGNSYDGGDQPSGYIAQGFAETFRLVVVDACDGDRVIGMSRKTVTVQW